MGSNISYGFFNFMKIIILYILISFSLIANSRNIAIGNDVNSYYIGKFGVVYSAIKMDDGMHHVDVSCSKDLKSFVVKNWKITFSAACDGFRDINTWLIQDNENVFKLYIKSINKLIDFIEYIYDESPNFKLNVIFINQNSFYKNSFLEFVYDSISLHTYALITSENFTQVETRKLQNFLVSTISHEFFHLYGNRYLKKRSNLIYKTLREKSNNEALATVLERCASFALGDAGFEMKDYSQLKKDYHNGIDANDIFLEGVKGYSNGIYALWDQFGTDVQPFEKSKISDMLKFCRYVVQTIPDVEALREIRLSDYLPMPRPDFYWDFD